MSREKSFFGKLISGLLVIVVFLLAVAGVGAYFLNKKFDVNVFDLVRTVRALNQPVSDTDFVTDTFTDEDMAGVKTTTDTVLPDLISKDADGTYNITPEKVSTTMSGDLKLTDKQMAGLINYMFKSATGDDTAKEPAPDTEAGTETAALSMKLFDEVVTPDPKPDDKAPVDPDDTVTPDTKPDDTVTPDPNPDDTAVPEPAPDENTPAPAPQMDINEMIVNILQVKFSNITETSADITIVVKLSLGQIKETMNDFPMNLVNKYVPENLYVTSICTVAKGEDAFGYTIANKDFTVNKLTGEKTADLFKIINKAAGTGAASDISVGMCKLLCEIMIKGSADDGFAYSLTKAGAVGYAFETDGTNNYFVIKK